MPFFKNNPKTEGLDDGTMATIRALAGDGVADTIGSGMTAAKNIVSMPTRAFGLLANNSPMDNGSPFAMARKAVGKVGEALTTIPDDPQSAAFSLFQPGEMIAGSMQSRAAMRGVTVSREEWAALQETVKHAANLRATGNGAAILPEHIAAAKFIAKYEAKLPLPDVSVVRSLTRPYETPKFGKNKILNIDGTVNPFQGDIPSNNYSGSLNGELIPNILSMYNNHGHSYTADQYMLSLDTINKLVDANSSFNNPPYWPKFGGRAVSGEFKSLQDNAFHMLQHPDYPPDLLAAGHNYVAKNAGLEVFGKLAEEHYNNSAPSYTGKLQELLKEPDPKKFQSGLYGLLDEFPATGDDMAHPAMKDLDEWATWATSNTPSVKGAISEYLEKRGGTSYRELLNTALTDVPEWVRVYRGEPLKAHSGTGALNVLGYENFSFSPNVSRRFTDAENGMPVPQGQVVRANYINKKDIIALGSPGELEGIAKVGSFVTRENQPIRPFKMVTPDVNILDPGRVPPSQEAQVLVSKMAVGTDKLSPFQLADRNKKMIGILNRDSNAATKKAYDAAIAGGVGTPHPAPTANSIYTKMTPEFAAIHMIDTGSAVSDAISKVETIFGPDHPEHETIHKLWDLYHSLNHVNPNFKDDFIKGVQNFAEGAKSPFTVGSDNVADHFVPNTPTAYSMTGSIASLTHHIGKAEKAGFGPDQIYTHLAGYKNIPHSVLMELLYPGAK